MLNFDLISDFHVEMNPLYDGHTFYNWKSQQQSDILVIAGDSGNDVMMSCMVIKEAAAFYKHVIVTDGNHEHYGWGSDGNTNVVVDKIRSFINAYCNNVKFLHTKNSILIHDKEQNKDVAFVGGNGWYDFKLGVGDPNLQKMAWQRFSNDFKIQFSHPPEELARHAAKHIQQSIEKALLKEWVNDIVVVTHTVPLRMFLEVREWKHDWNQLNGAYGNSLMEDIAFNPDNRIRVWTFGHTHRSYDDVINGVNFVSNPRGYYRELREKPFQGIKTVYIA